MKVLVSLVSLLVISFSFAGEKEKVVAPDTIEIHGKKLFLNGMGIRRATWLNIKVYVGSLYVLQKSTDAIAILDQPYPKHINMTFLRDVDLKSLIGAWEEGFFAAVQDPLRSKLMPYLKELNSRMVEMKKKEVILVNFLENGVEVFVKGKAGPIIGDKSFSKALLSIWFFNPRDKQLREEILGKK